MYNEMAFATQGDWDSTTLTHNGNELPADKLFVHFQQQIDKRGNRGAGDLTAYVNTREEPDVDAGIFPGVLSIDVPNHKIVIRNVDPHFAFGETSIEYQDIVVTESVSEFHLEIDSVANVVQGYITLWQGPIATDQPYETFTIL